MELKAIVGDISRIETDGVIIPHLEGLDKPADLLASLDQALGGEISRLIAEGAIKGKLYEITLITTLGRLPARRLVVVGLGKAAELSADRVRGAVAEACRALRRAGARRISIPTPFPNLELQLAAQAAAEGGLLGLYTFRQHITRPPEYKDIEEITLLTLQASNLIAVEQGLAQGRVLAEATNLCRNLVNEPANVLTPIELAERAKQVAQAWGLEINVLDRPQMQELGMGGLLGVAQGSQQPPKFIVLNYWGASRGKKPLALVGKGITFDSGGISLKPAEGMGDMKEDMAGGAAVISALRAIAELKLLINVAGLVPATENLPSGTALKPGDIIKMMNGKTVEISSTDAEGRLILADALSYARRHSLSPIIDLATLTGACHVALGDLYSGVFSNNRELLDQIVKAGEMAGEKHWPLPLVEEYKEQLKSDAADLKNVGARYGGAITAALFLAEFVEDTPWAHLDIAGPVRTDKDRGYLVKGATGIGVRTLVNLALARAGQ